MEQRYIRLLLTSLVTMLTMQSNSRVVAQDLPKLVVCISVDQLRGELLNGLKPMMSEEGFRRLLAGGLYFPSVDFPLVKNNAVASTASIHTGLLPSGHGVIANQCYSRQKKTWTNLFVDKHYNGVYSRSQVSPKAIRVATLGDRLKLASKNSSLVYSIAPSMGVAMVSAGVLADGAFWLDDIFGSWATTNYYPHMPSFLSSYNNSSQSINRRLVLGQISWKPLRAYQKNKTAYSSWAKKFNYSYDSKKIEAYKHSAKINEELTDLAIKFVKNAGYQNRKSPSLLSLSYTLYPNTEEETSAEDLDMYLRLDQDLKRLFASLNKEVGLEDCLLVLSGTGYVRQPSFQKTKAYRYIDTDQAKALVNMYLSAVYGVGQWVEEFANGELFLNKKLIAKSQKPYSEITRATARILQEVEGVSSAYSCDDLLYNATSQEAKRLKNSIDPKHLADVYCLPLANWHMLPMRENPNVQPQTTGIQSPLIIYRAGHKFVKEDFVVQDVRDIVKVVCQILRIRPPN